MSYAKYYLYILNHQDNPIFKGIYNSNKFSINSNNANQQPSTQSFNEMLNALVGAQNRSSGGSNSSISINNNSILNENDKPNEELKIEQDVMDLVAYSSLDVIEDVQSKSPFMLVYIYN